MADSETGCQLVSIDLLQFLYPAEGNPVENDVVHAQHQGRGDHKLTPAVIDLVSRLRDRMGRQGCSVLMKGGV